ncbi:MAG: tyrosine--tRNA ligase [Phycisphaerales bacterium JB040]
MDFLDELSWRGLLKDCTDLEGLRAHLSDPEGSPRKAYAGFDPTADSLTIGNLVPIMCLAHFKRAGHVPVVLQGGGTGLIGDPSGKSAERQLNTRETVSANVAAQKGIFEAVLGKVEGRPHEHVNNDDWLSELSYIDALRDIGKHFSVNMMMQKESVRERLNNREQGISYTEFSYMILQAYDFAHLYEADGITVQLGGSDQYGNIVAGADLIRRINAQQLAPSASEGVLSESETAAFGLTAPLVQKADGGKFGKTESGAVWLSANRTSPYAYYQFWLNASDDDVSNFLRTFTFLPKDEIEAIEAAHTEAPGKREAQRRLAQEATSILHGEDAMRQAEEAGKALFSGNIAGLDEATLNEVFASVPSFDRDKGELAGDGADPVELLKAMGAASSNREAREFIANGSVSINGQRLDEGQAITESHLLHGSIIAIRRGKKKWFLTRWK